ncbi:MAG: hypothetical protein N4A50_10395 [Vallitalea sp.]|jgi:hypothetical protein|nr:hypothetical protein [Vallitalea sp.]
MKEHFICPNCGKKVFKNGSICDSCGEVIINQRHIPYLNSLVMNKEKKEVILKSTIVIIVSALILLFLFYPRSISDISSNYKNQVNQLRVRILEMDRDTTILIEDKQKISNILEYIEEHKGRWTRKGKTINTTNHKSYFLWFTGDNFYIDISLLGNKYVSVWVNDYGVAKPSHSSFAYRPYGIGINSNELYDIIVDKDEYKKGD